MADKKQDNNILNEKDIASKIQEEEIGGQSGPEPTRYGDWEKNGRVSDF